jgi:hypothetical protein
MCPNDPFIIGDDAIILLWIPVSVKMAHVHEVAVMANRCQRSSLIMLFAQH